MRMARRMALLCISKEVTQPLYTGTYNIVTIGNYKYLYMTSGGTLTIQDTAEYDLFVVGGGGAGGSYTDYDEDSMDLWNGGGGGGKTATLLAKNINSGTALTVTIGSGGSSAGVAGGKTSIGSLLSAVGGSSPSRITGKHNHNGAAGGSGGGASGSNSSGSPDGDRPAKGGTNGSAGASNGDGNGGAGQNTTTRGFAETNGTLYAGGGGGGDSYRYGLAASGGDATAGGGSNPNGTVNTGGGGAGAVWNNSTYKAGAGGSGLAVIRWKVA